jgi:ATP-dependent DNA helicase RecG
MKRRAIVRGLFREDLWEYPEEAIREALVNAMGHRDLSDMSHGTSVHAQMFPDRLVVTNPGGLFGPVTVDRLGLEGISSRRNQTLMTLLEDTVIPEERRVVCENRGTGIGAILAALRQAGMGPPSFDNHISTFQLTFPNHTLLDEETLRWLARVRGFELTDSQRMGLALARRGDLLTNDSYRRFTDVDSRVATRELGDLVRRDLLVQDGAHRWTTYRFRPEPPPPPEPTSESERSRRTRADRRPAILALLAEHGELSRAEIVTHLGLTDANARKWIRILIDEGAIKPTSLPRSKHQSYRLASV